MGIRRFLSGWGDGLAEILIPSSCIRCGPGVPDDGIPGLCTRCLAGLRPFPASEQCRVCALPLGLDPLRGRDRCGNCAALRVPYAGITALGDYDDGWGELVRALKFHGARVVARGLGELLAGQILGDAESWRRHPADIVVPVPLSGRRRRERGFNQAEDLSRPLADLLHTPLRIAALRRRRDGEHQVGRGRSARRRLGSGTFDADPRWVWGRRVLVVDDVVTTTSTLRAAARVLLSAGAIEVRAIVVARTGSSTDPAGLELTDGSRRVGDPRNRKG